MKSSSGRRTMLLASLAAILASTMWGFTSMAAKIGMAITSPAVMLMWRFWLSLAAMLIVSRLLHEPLSLPRREWKYIPLLGIFQPVLYYIFEEYGILASSAGFSGIMFAMGPIVEMLMAFLFLREVPTLLQVLFSLLSIAGVVAISIASAGVGSSSLLGAVLMTGAVLSGSAYFIVGRKFSQRISVFQRTFYMVLSGFVAYTVWALIDTRGDLAMIAAPLRSPSFLGVVAFTSIGATVIAHLSFHYAVNHLSVTRLAAYGNVCTVVSVAAGIVILHEVFPLGVLIPGMAAILIGIWGVQSFTAARRNEKELPHG